ncbi:endonuclease/exonuclease/phosphatase family protein [Actinocorallia sp. API 0066]|uniref:endonuclease/exonuclease/phosphatase family protein n=1 Tax=Actinocorallia sp. API 0066 TaxID=2896846 RepID=UPI001E60B884|nr:endonuclease/exonuclease/phosphatase family protein [Actinocorallia sp. API 0066]MCD0449047.1 endonuclease/exonuclease/phosphatase family protein [Actinocorallia sp. API 0066]
MNTPEPLRLLHWNIHSWQDPNGGKNVEQVAGLIAETRPHVVSLVEVDETFAAADNLAHAADGYVSIFIPALVYGTAEDVFGNALLTRLPLLAVQHWPLRHPAPHYDGTEPTEQRTLTCVRIHHHNTPIWIGTTHLPRTDHTERTRTLHQLHTITHHLTTPWIIAGDFNTPSTWTNHNGLTTAPTNTPTYPAPNPTEPIDYCIANAHTTLDGSVLTHPGSDHQPILVTAHFA